MDLVYYVHAFYWFQIMGFYSSLSHNNPLGYNIPILYWFYILPQLYAEYISGYICLRCYIYIYIDIYWILFICKISMIWKTKLYTVYPKKYAHSFVVLCFVVVMQSFIMNSHKEKSMFIRVALLALGQSLDCHSASEVSLIDMGKSVNV